jgi:hypothetical protein
MIFTHLETGLQINVKIINHKRRWKDCWGKKHSVITRLELVSDTGQPVRSVHPLCWDLEHNRPHELLMITVRTTLGSVEMIRHDPSDA